MGTGPKFSPSMIQSTIRLRYTFPSCSGSQRGSRPMLGTCTRESATRLQLQDLVPTGDCFTVTDVQMASQPLIVAHIWLASCSCIHPASTNLSYTPTAEHTRQTRDWQTDTWEAVNVTNALRRH